MANARVLELPAALEPLEDHSKDPVSAYASRTLEASSDEVVEFRISLGGSDLPLWFENICAGAWPYQLENETEHRKQNYPNLRVTNAQRTQ
jgi:hypothetical protein